MHRLLLAAVVLAACSPSVDPTNPYDPGTPPELQAKATVRGALATTVLASAADLPVALRTGGRIVSQVSTGPTGAFVFDRLVPGDYQVETAATGFMTQSIAVSLQAGDDLDLGEIALVPLYGASAATLVGTVTLEGRTDGSGTLVEAVGKSYTALTDESGGFRITAIAGDYTLRFSHADFLPVTTAVFTVGAGEEYQVPDGQLLSNPATVSGRVEGELPGGGTGPLVDAFVTLDGTSLTAVTNAAGDFTLTGIPSGSYLLRVVKSGYEATSIPVLNLVGGELRSLTDPLALALSRGAIAGAAALADSADASGVLVELVGTGRALVTGSDGAFTFSDLLVGSSYEVTARRDGYAPQSRTGISVVAGVTTTLPFPLTLARQGGTVSIVEAPYATSPAVTLQLAATGVTHYRASEDAGFAGASWLPFTVGVGQGFSLADADGEHVVYVQFATDGSGSNPSAVVSASVVLDRVAPVAPVLVVGDGSGWTRTVGGLVGLTLSAQDLAAVAGGVASGLDRMELVNGADFSSGVQSYPYNTSSTWLLAAPTTDGPKTVSARFVDRAGNVSAPVAAAVTLDTLAPSAPSVALAGPDPARPGETNTPIVTASLSASDANGGPASAWLFVRLANTSGFVGARYQPFEASLSWLLAAGDGDKTVWAQFMDPAGNESAPVSATIHLDTSGPSAPSLAVTEGDARPTNGQTSVAAVTLTLSASGTPVEAIVAENPALTGGTLFDLRSVPLPAAVPFTLGGLGLRTLWVRYYDSAGNPSELATATVTLDQTAPAATPPAIAPSPHAPTTAITVTPPNAGQDEILIAGAGIAGTPSYVAAPAGVPIAATLTAGDGAKAIAVTYRDLAENATAAAGLSVTLDGAAPSASNFTVRGALADGTASTTVTTSQSVTLDLSGQSDAGSGLTEMLLSESAAFTGAAWQPFAAAVPFTLSSGDGTKTVYAKFKDAVGNATALAVTGSIVLDTTGPAAPSALLLETDARPSNGHTNSRAYRLTLDASGTPVRALVAESAGFGGATTVSLVGQPLPYTTAAGTLSLADADGVHTVWVRFFDAAGNGSEAVAASVTLDRSAPGAVAPTLTPSAWAPTTSITVTPPNAGQDEIQIAGAGIAGTPSFVAAPAGVPIAATLTAGDGAKAIAVTYRDLAENATAVAGLSVTLDGAAPSASNFTVRGALADGTASTTVTTSQSVTLDLSGQSDAGSGLAQMLLSESATFAGASWQPYAAAAPFTLSAGDATKTVYLKLKDALGNTTALAVSGSIALDTGGPGSPGATLIETDTRPSNGYTNSRAYRLTLNASGTPTRALVAENPSFAGATTVSLVGQTLPYTTAAGVLNLADADGSHVVWVRYFDAAGNPSDPATASVVLDRSAPANLAPTLSASGFTGSTAITLTPPNAGQDELQLAGAGVLASAGFLSPAWGAAPAGVPIALTLTSGDGAKAISVTYRDLADNATAVTPGLVVALDGAAPAASNFTVTGTLADGTTSTTYAASGSVTLNLSAQADGTGSGIQEMLLSNVNTFAGAAWQPFSSSSAVPWILSPGDGVKTVYAKFRDAVGNTTAVAVTGTITLAATPPSGGTLVVEGGATATNKSTVSLAVSATGATQLRVSVDGAAGGWIAYPPSPAATATLSDPDQVNKVIQVTFRNAARVEGAGASASIRYDHTAPTAGTLTLAGTLGNGTTSTALTTTAPLVAQLVPPTADTAEMAIAQTTTATLCSSVFASPTWQPVARSATVVLTGADGAKRICALFRDGAGNSLAANAVGADITLDTSAPPNPSFVNVLSSTTNAYYAPAAGSPTVTAVSDPNGVTYQCIGGTSPAYGPTWVDCGATATLTSAFLLPVNQESTLGVRARDNAHNYSPGSFVRIVQDSVAPFPPFIADIRSSRDSVSITWDATADSDVVQYLVHYGNTPDDLTGTGAAQGASPVAAGAFFGIANPSFTLTGLTPGLPYYVAVEAVDAAGNRSGPSGVRLAVPNKVNPRVLSAFGGQPRSIGVLATATRTFAYLGQNQGIVQLDVSNDGGLPAVTGRAYLPDFVPDDRGSIAVFACGKLVGAITVQGHCAVPAGSTLEGDYRNDRDNYRAASPIVFFRTDGTSGAPTVGTIEGILPVRPHFVLTNVFDGDTYLYTVDRDGVRAFTFYSGKLAFLRQTAYSPFDDYIQTIHGVGVFGDTVWVYARPDPRVPERSSILWGFDMADASGGDIYRTRYGELFDDADRSLGSSYYGTPTPLTLFHGGIYLAFTGYYTDQVTLASYTPGNPYPEQILTFPSGSASDGDQPIASAGGTYNHLYVLSSGGMSDPTVWQATASGTLLTPAGSAQDQGWDTSYAISMLKHDLSERLLTISRPVYPYWEMERWAVNGSTLTPLTTVPFREIPPDQFAESDRFLLVAQADKIHTVDVANPMAPIVVNTYTRGASRNFTKLRVHGRFLYAAAGLYGVEVYRINGSGTLTYRGAANPGNVTDLAVAGRYLFVTSSNGLSAYNVTSIASGVAPTLVQTLAVSPFLADAVDARITSAGGTSYAAVVYVAGREAGSPTMKTYTFNGAALAAYSTGTWTGDPGFTVEVRGNYAAVGTATATQLMYVGSGSPSAYRTHSTVSGPGLLQAGYVVSGSSFVGLSGGAVDGTVRYSTCGPDYNGASIAHSTGLYAASCMKNGIMLYTPVALGGGRLHNSRDVSPDWWGTGRFATDGMSVWLTGPEVSGDRSRLYVASEITTAEGTLSNPGWTGVNLQSTTTNGAAMAWADGVLYVVTSQNPVTVDAYDPSSWTLLSRYTFGTWGSAVAAVTDGEYLYIARSYLGSGYIDALDIRNPWSMSIRASASVASVTFRALALSRDRLYAAADQGPSEINSTYVWDVSTVQASATMSAATTVAMGGEGSITGVAVVGPWLFFSVHDPTYMAPLYGMGVRKLGANRDGNGAVGVGSVQETLQPLQSPNVAGDVLYFAANAGLATWDLTPLWRDGAAPTPAGSVNLADPLITGAPVNFQIVGPFGFLTGGVYRVFDLR